MTTPLRRWTQLPARERWLVVHAAVALLILRMVVGWVSLPRLVRTIQWTPLRSETGWHPQRIVALVDGVAFNLPWQSSCLHRSLAAAWLMRRRSVDATLAVGVGRVDGAFAAHAWLEYAARPLAATDAGYTRIVMWQVSPDPSTA